MPGPGAWGPYQHGQRWRVTWRERNGATGVKSFPNEASAEDFKREIAAAIVREEEGELTVEGAVTRYEDYLAGNGNKPSSLTETPRRLRWFFAEILEGALELATSLRCQKLYDRITTATYTRGGVERTYSVDTCRNTLAEVKTFLNWCFEKKWLKENPAAGVKGKGKRNHGKAQPRVDEARTWLACALERAPNEPGAVAALCTILLGMRADEIVSRVVRDLDDGGRLLWIPDAKTKKGRRTLEVPEEREVVLGDGTRGMDGFPLRQLLLKLAEGKGPDDLLFGKHCEDWPNENVQRICRLAGIPKVTAHGMRGFRGTLGLLGGLEGALRKTADTLGHEDSTTTVESYIAPGTVQKVEQEATLRLLGRQISVQALDTNFTMADPPPLVSNDRRGKLTFVQREEIARRLMSSSAYYGLMTELAREYGVSEAAVRKLAKKVGVGKFADRVARALSTD